MRFAILGISHETNTFSSVPTDYGQFEASGILRGQEIVAEYRRRALPRHGLPPGRRRARLRGRAAGLRADGPDRDDHEGRLRPADRRDVRAAPCAGTVGRRADREPRRSGVRGAPRHGRRVLGGGARDRRSGRARRDLPRHARQRVEARGRGDRRLRRLAHQPAPRSQGPGPQGGRARVPDGPRRDPAAPVDRDAAAGRQHPPPVHLRGPDARARRRLPRRRTGDRGSSTRAWSRATRTPTPRRWA